MSETRTRAPRRRRSAKQAHAGAGSRQQAPSPRVSAQNTTARVCELELGQPLSARGEADGGQRFSLIAGVPGERISLRPRGSRPAELLAVLSPAPGRHPTACPHVGRCGGCSLQELDYPAQLAQKTAALRQALVALGCPGSQVAPVQGMPQPFGYRTRLLMPAAGSGGTLRLGYYLPGSMELVAAEGCPVQHPLTLGVLAAARMILAEQGVAASAKDGDGWLHALAIRSDPPSGQSDLTLIGRSAALPGGEATLAALAQIPSLQGLHLCVHPARSSYPLEGEITTLAGSSRLGLTLGGQTFPLSPGTFFQTNAAGAELLAASVLEQLPRQLTTLADLYGGAGLFALLAAERWRQATVVDLCASAHADLLALRQQRPQLELTALAARVEQVTEQVLSASPDAVLLDPPRRGCHPRVLQALGAARPALVLYVSCGFASLLQDALRLLELGFVLEGASAVDMFPHTPHLEVVACFRPAR